MTTCCPSCGRALPKREWPDLEYEPETFRVRRGGVEVQMTKREAAFFDALYRRPHGFADMRSLFTAVYVEDEEGGPLSISPITAIYLGRLRHHLAPLGIGVTSGRGAPRSGYRMVDLRKPEVAA